MAVTIRDVAQAAGVSPMAVSKVLHGRGRNIRVSEESAKRIRSTAERMNYRANALARSLRTQKTNTIALVFEEFERLGGNTGYFIELFDGVMSAAFEGGYSVTICPKMVNFSRSGVTYDGRFDGLIWCKPERSETTIDALRGSVIPIVALHAAFADEVGLPLMGCDNAQGMELAVGHLYDLGHRTFSFAVDPANAAADEAHDRFNGFRDALARRGIAVDASQIHRWGHQGEGFAEAFKTGKLGTALVVFGEGQAGEILKRAAENGISVPSEISVIGFDSTRFCETTSPRMTAVRQPVEEMARHAAKVLIDQIEGRPVEKSRKVFPCSLDVRSSTGPSPQAREAHQPGGGF